MNTDSTPALQQDKMDWECVHNHLPKWIDELDTALSAVITKADHDRVMGMLKRYNDLTDIEEDNSNDGNSIYGIENEKEDLIKDIISIYDKYREEATKLRYYGTKR